MEELWGDDQPKGAPNALQVLVSRLRRILGQEASAIATVPNGYRLELATSNVDWVRFETAVAQGRALLADRDPIAAAAVLTDALSSWRGEPFEGATMGVLHDAATRLHALRLNALEDRLDAELQAGRHSEVVEELGRLAAEHPLRERFHGLLMLALYRCGRQADALRAYSAARAVLLDELGVDPSRELRDLEVMILRQDPTLTSVESVASRAGFRTNLPHAVGAFSELPPSRPAPWRHHAVARGSSPARCSPP
jgi:DNA-binding SARP family transcriptional activator